MSQYEMMVMLIALSSPDPEEAELERLEALFGPKVVPMTEEEAAGWGDSQTKEPS